MSQQETWKEIWLRKGKERGGKEELLALDGYEKTTINMKKVANCITEELQIKKTDRVLEVGCGAGALAQYLDCSYVGIDYSETLVQKHIEILQNSVLVGEACDLIFRDNSFDKIICYGVFLYFDSKEYAKKTIEELKRVSKSGILIGELPIRSHRKEHLLFQPEEFNGFKISNGFYDPYRKDRFNATFLW